MTCNAVHATQSQVTLTQTYAMQCCAVYMRVFHEQCIGSFECSHAEIKVCLTICGSVGLCLSVHVPMKGYAMDVHVRAPLNR